MSIAQFSIGRESIFGQRQYVATLHFCGKRFSALLGTDEPTASDLEQAERRLRNRISGKRPSNYVAAHPGAEAG